MNEKTIKLKLTINDYQYKQAHKFQNMYHSLTSFTSYYTKCKTKNNEYL